MARTKKPTTRSLDDRGRLLYVIQQHWTEILQISPWIMDEEFNLVAHGADPVDFADFALRMHDQFENVFKYPETVLDCVTIGDCLALTESVLPAEFDYAALPAPYEVPIV